MPDGAFLLLQSVLSNLGKVSSIFFFGFSDVSDVGNDLCLKGTSEVFRRLGRLSAIIVAHIMASIREILNILFHRVHFVDLLVIDLRCVGIQRHLAFQGLLVMSDARDQLPRLLLLVPLGSAFELLW